jgi:hypothetical protein
MAAMKSSRAIRCIRRTGWRASTSACRARRGACSFESFVRRLPVKTKNLSLDYKARKFIEGMRYDDVVARHHVWFGSFTPDEQERC